MKYQGLRLDHSNIDSFHSLVPQAAEMHLQLQWDQDTNKSCWNSNTYRNELQFPACTIKQEGFPI
jgi:hypothetical protein